jgi:hypothetical protein
LSNDWDSIILLQLCKGLRASGWFAENSMIRLLEMTRITNFIAKCNKKKEEYLTPKKESD